MTATGLPAPPSGRIPILTPALGRPTPSAISRSAGIAPAGCPVTTPIPSVVLPPPGPPPVNVSFLIDNLSRAGTETQLLALIRELDRTRVRPTLVLLDGESFESRALEPTDCPVLRLGLKRIVGRSAFRAYRTLRDFWREHGTEVVQTYFLDSTYFGAIAARRAGIRRVVRVRNNLGYWLTPKHRILSRLVGKLSAVTLTNTEAGRDALIKADRLAPERVEVIPNGVDLGRFADFPTPFRDPARVTVGCVANLRPVKNIDGLIRAARWARLRAPQLRFEVAGDGPQRAELERLRDELGLGDRFVFRGSVADVPGFLRSVDLVALPSHSEGMSNAVLEGMAAGRPLVVTAVGANPVLVRDGIEGLVVPPGEERALVDALVRIAEEPALGRVMGAAARMRAEAEYSRDVMRRRFEDFYHRLRG